jgi:hypothetical protein
VPDFRLTSPDIRAYVTTKVGPGLCFEVLDSCPDEDYTDMTKQTDLGCLYGCGYPTIL